MLIFFGHVPNLQESLVHGKEKGSEDVKPNLAASSSLHQASQCDSCEELIPLVGRGQFNTDPTNFNNKQGDILAWKVLEFDLMEPLLELVEPVNGVGPCEPDEMQHFVLAILPTLG